MTDEITDMLDRIHSTIARLVNSVAPAITPCYRITVWEKGRPQYYYDCVSEDLADLYAASLRKLFAQEGKVGLFVKKTPINKGPRDA